MASLGQRPKWRIHAKPPALKARFNARPTNRKREGNGDEDCLRLSEEKARQSNAHLDKPTGTLHRRNFGRARSPKTRRRGLDLRWQTPNPVIHDPMKSQQKVSAPWRPAAVSSQIAEGVSIS